MKQKPLVLIVTLVLFGGLAWTNKALAWTATILAKGQYLGGVYKNSVKIGVAPEAQTSPALLMPPPQYSVKMDLYTPDLTTLLRKDIRQEGKMRYTWVIGIDPHGNILPSDPARTATLSWNPNEFEAGTYELREGFDGTGTIVVADMTITTSYDVEGTQEIQYFTLIFTEADGDEDDVPDRLDNCPNDPNPDQKDSDGDSFGDACDGCPDDPSKIDDTDFDGDGMPDCTDMDDDNDRMPDGWEIDNSLNPLSDDANEDPDGDGFSNLREYVADTNPQDTDDFPSILPEVENFETGDLSRLPWVTTGADVWSVTTTTNHTPDGVYAAEAPTLADRESASIKVRMYCEEGSVSFWYAVSSEQDYDFLYFYIDDIEHGAWSGEVSLTEATFAITSGMHTFQWVYVKDKSHVSGADTAWVDDISFPMGIDSDFDSMPDGWEIDNNLNPLSDDADEDPDGDCFSNFREYMADTNPQDVENFPPVTTGDLSLPVGWSMISLPVIPENTSLSNLFPDAVVVYGYEKSTGYVRVRNDENLVFGRGYWILLDEEKTYTLTGQPTHSHTKTVSEDGWEMIGGCTCGARLTTEGCNIGVIYSYAQGAGYQQVQELESLTPGQGYWILFDDVMHQAEMRVEAMTQSGR